MTVCNNTLAKRIIFQSYTATGVALDTFILSVRHEVILSAGAFQSPQLLMGSGIGPATTLVRFDIPVVADRQGVGKNMWDHFLFGPSYQVNVLTHSVLGNNASYVAAVNAEYDQNGSGIVGNPGGEMLAWEG